MRPYIIIVLLVIGMYEGFAQNRLDGKRDLVDQSANPGAVIEELPLPPAGIKGNTYLDDNWHEGKIYLTNGKSISGFPLKLDIKLNHLEVKAEEEVKVCPYHLIDKFYFYNYDMSDSTLFVKAEEYQFKNGAPLLGFFEFVYKGAYSLVKYHESEIQQSNYVEALDMGDRDKKIVINTTQYFIKGNSILCEFSTRIKSMKDCLPGEFQQHKTYIKENDINLKKEKGQIEFLSYLNGLNQ